MRDLIRTTGWVCALLLALGPLSAGMARSAGAGAGSLQWSVMTDAFGTTVDYPAGIFTAEKGAPPLMVVIGKVGRPGRPKGARNRHE